MLTYYILKHQTLILLYWYPINGLRAPAYLYYLKILAQKVKEIVLILNYFKSNTNN